VLRQRFLTKLRQRYDHPRLDLHVSDLTFCMRESYFRKVNPQPHDLKTLQYFVDGARRHEALQELLGVDSEVEVSKYGVVGHIDMVDDDLFQFIPIEIKTTRAKKEIPEHYFTQLGYYCVLLGVRRGRLIIQRIMNKEEPWEFYDVEWTEKEIKELEEELKYKATLFQKALKTRNPKLLPKIHEAMKWKCRSCKYVSLCEKIESASKVKSNADNRDSSATS